MNRVWCWLLGHKWYATQKWRPISDTELQFYCKCRYCPEKRWL